MAFWRNINPAGAIGDFAAVWRGAGPTRWRFMVLAALTTTGVFWAIVHEESRITPRPPEITYINSWPANRSEAEILAGNRANQRRKDRLAVEQAQRDAEVKHIYKTIGRVSGMDVDAIDRAAQADAARDAALAKARQAALYASEQAASQLGK